MECQNSSSHGSTATHQPLRYVARMGRYRDHIVPRLVELSCGAKGIDRWRVSAMDGLAGRVIEIGFGSGLNVPHYPEAVTEVLAVEPAATARKIAEARSGASRIPIVHVGLDGQAVALPDASCEAALCTFSLCTIPDPSRALDEVARILVPGGRLHLLEHGRAPDPRVASWQRRIDPIERRIADGCHLTRDPVALLEASGYTIERCEQRYARGPKPWSYFTVAVAVAP